MTHAGLSRTTEHELLAWLAAARTYYGPLSVQHCCRLLGRPYGGKRHRSVRVTLHTLVQRGLARRVRRGWFTVAEEEA